MLASSAPIFQVCSVPEKALLQGEGPTCCFKTLIRVKFGKSLPEAREKFSNSPLGSVSSYFIQLQCCSKLLLKALFYRAHECEGLARRGFRRLLPKALEKFPNCPFSSQLRKYNRWCCPKLLFQAVCVRVYEYACSRCCSTRLLQDVLTIL